MSPLRRLAAAIGVLALVAAGHDARSAEDVIALGAAVSLTGKYAVNGTNTKNGYDLAVRQINNDGGVEIAGKTYTLEIRYYDDESRPARATELVERLVKQDGVTFILGPYGSGLTKAVMPIVEQYKVPMVQANGAARELFTNDYRYMFGVLSTADKYFTSALELAVGNADKFGKGGGILSLAMATENDPFGRDVRAGVLEDAMRLGINCVIDDQLPPELDDMSVTLSKVKTLKPDLLLISGRAKGAVTAVKQIAALQVDVPMIALTHCDSARLAEKLPKASSHIFCAHQWHPTLGYKDAVFGSAEDFAQRYLAVFGGEAPYQAAQAAASVYVFADAFKRAQSLDPEKVRNALAATDLTTFYGRIKLDETGKNIAKPMVLTQIVDGEYVIVAPEDSAARAPIIPRPAAE